MKSLYTSIAVALLAFCSTSEIAAQTIWNGPTITFTKENGADPNTEAAQDRITDLVWLTRANNLGLFNIVVEASDADGDACEGPEPSGTEWAYGTTADISTLTFAPLGTVIGCNFSELIDGNPMVLHLIQEDIYIDLTFTSWTSGGGNGGNAGGFAYERSTQSGMSINDVAEAREIVLFPNPAQDILQVKGLVTGERFTIYNNLGQALKEGFFTNNGQVETQNLEAGNYFLHLEDGTTFAFQKN